MIKTYDKNNLKDHPSRGTHDPNIPISNICSSKDIPQILNQNRTTSKDINEDINMIRTMFVSPSHLLLSFLD